METKSLQSTLDENSGRIFNNDIVVNFVGNKLISHTILGSHINVWDLANFTYTLHNFEGTIFNVVYHRTIC